MNLTDLSELELIAIAQSGAKNALEAKTTLLMRNQGLWKYYAKVMWKRYLTSSNLELADMEQECAMGYLKAIDIFDASRGKPLKSIAYFQMLFNARKYYESFGTLIKRPQKMIELSGKVKQIRDSYEALSKPVPTDAYDHLFKSDKQKMDYYFYFGTILVPVQSYDALSYGTDSSDGYNSIEPVNDCDTETQVVTESALAALRDTLKLFSYRDAAWLIGKRSDDLLLSIGLNKEDFSIRSLPKVKGIDRKVLLQEEFIRQLEQKNYNKKDLMEVFTS